MASTIVTKNSVTTTSAPTISDIIQGELALNLVDGALFSRDNANNIVRFGVVEGTPGADNIPRYNSITGAWESSSVLQIDAAGDIDVSGDIDATGDIFANALSGNGALVTNVQAATLDGIDSTQFLRSDTADIMTGGSLTMNDNIKLLLGSGADAELYFDATNTLLNLVAGDLYLKDGGTTRAVFSRATGNLNLSTGELQIAGTALTTGFKLFRTLTQATYDGLTPDADTVYFING